MDPEHIASSTILMTSTTTNKEAICRRALLKTFTANEPKLYHVERVRYMYPFNNITFLSFPTENIVR